MGKIHWSIEQKRRHLYEPTTVAKALFGSGVVST
uniref:Uncharacterized protein n=1 Tax=Arundo donax TaxID=35708 RepID=A0A0A9BDI5_ARUDO